jgi:hypothetical protein
MSISIGLGKDYYSLTGDIDLIKNKRRVKSNFRSYGADFDSEEDKIMRFYLHQELKNYKHFEKMPNDKMTIIVTDTVPELTL